MRIAVTGSSGLIGSALVAALEAAGHTVVRVTRPGSRAASDSVWDPASGSVDASVFAGADAVVNLGGRSIGERRWTEEEKALVYGSRVDATRLLVGALASLDDPPQTLVSASAVGYYGDRGDQVLTEDDGPGRGFLAEVSVDWEAAAQPAAAAGVRVVTLRTGIVLSGEGGALGRLLAPLPVSWIKPYQWGLGGWVGGGRQWWSWISIEDTVRAIVHLLGSGLAGPVNLTAPNPARNKPFMKAVGRALGKPVVLPIPGFVVDAMLGRELARATLHDSTRAHPDRLLADGFEFHHPDLDPALRAALSG